MGSQAEPEGKCESVPLKKKKKFSVIFVYSQSVLIVLLTHPIDAVLRFRFKATSLYN